MKYKSIFVSATIAFLFFVSLLHIGNIPQAKAVLADRVFTSTISDGMITLGHTTYSVIWGSLTGFIYDTDSSYFIGQTNTTQFYIHRSFLFFDTSALPPDANITSAVLSLNIKTDYSATDFNVTIQNGQPTYPRDPLETGDYYYGYYSGNGGNRSTSDGLSVGSYWNITLTSDGRSWIQKGGTTKLALRSSEDIASSEPTDDEYVEIYYVEGGLNVAPKLYITYDYNPYTFNLHGAYDEQGNRDGAINVTFYRPTQQWINFTLDGLYTATSEEDTRMVFHFDLGYNQSRVFYVGDQAYMDIYVFKPSDPYYTYYFTIVDLVGITNGYLETILNINGTDRIVERWRLDVMNNIPFIMTWGRAYTIRLTSDQGTYTWGMFVASAESSQTLTITPGMFPVSYPGLNVTANALRKNSTWIQVNYTDNEALTSWVQITIQHKVSFSWVTDYTQNNTGNTHQLDWYSADEDVDYLAKVTALQDDETKTWGFSLPKPALTTNPWDVLDSLGTWPFPAENVIGLGLVLMVFGVFSYFSMPVGSVLGVFTAAFLTLIGWLDMNWNLIALAGAVAIFAGLAKAKREEREI